MHLHVTRTKALHDLDHTRKVHRLMQAVVECLPNHRMIWNFDWARVQIVRTRCEARKKRCHPVVRLHPLDRRRISPSALKAEHKQGAIQIPTPSSGKHRRSQDGLGQCLFDTVRM